MSTVSLRAPAWHEPLLEFLPLARTIAAKAFAHLSPAEKDDAVQDVVADSTAEFARLAERGRPHFWLIGPIARYAVRRRTAGRRVGTATNKADVLSPVPRGEAHVVSLDLLESGDPETWRAAVADSKRTDPAEAAAFRVDFSEWFASLPERHREIATSLINGERPGDVARKFGVTAGRISQLRTELRDSWETFQGGGPSDKDRPLAAA